MSKIKTLVLVVALLSYAQIICAQDYNFYLQKARQRIAEGDCTRAEASYNTYKDMAHKTNKEIERLIEECKTAGTGIFGGDMTFTVNDVSFTMKPIEGGTFWMGAQSDDPNAPNYNSDAVDEEQPVHQVTLNSFYLGETEVTQELWLAVMGEDPGWEERYGIGSNYPAYRVSWTDCQEFIRKLNRLTGKRFRLPTEAEWEYAARGGNKSKGYLYAGSNLVDQVSWHQENSEENAHPIKTKRANEIGLFDMSGNLWEWCDDWFDDYNSGSQTNPKGPSDGTIKVLRGGSWFDDYDHGLLSNRFYSVPGYASYYIGIRLALTQ